MPERVPTDLDVIAFATTAALSKWLARHHASSPGIWLRMYKKGSGVATVTHDEALDEALCWGWIDGQTAKYDDTSFLQRFTPRRARSLWSKRNCENVARLEREGRMQDAGRAQIDAAKADGRWDKAYDSPGNVQVPADFMAALKKDKKALAFFGTLKRVNHYAIAYRLHHAKKPETRQRRFELFLQKLRDGKPIV
jgi:uncharacterized protein YdeI (YjbR/CyaY-like superfamily)